MAPPPEYYPPYQAPTPAYGPPVNGPEEITEFDQNSPAPYGYTKVTRKRKGLIIGGSVTLGAVYGVSALAAAVNEDLRRNGSTTTDISALWIPVAGPFIQLGRAETSTGRLFLAHLAAGQAAGAIMLVYGLTSPRTLLVRNDQLSITPLIAPGASGMMVAGSF